MNAYTKEWSEAIIFKLDKIISRPRVDYSYSM